MSRLKFHLAGLALCLGLCFTLAASAQDPERKPLKLDIGKNGYELTVGIPPGWSLAPEYSRNSRTLVNVMPGERR
ncbi:MAG: hypothetical protein RQ826_12680, partial [Xanthomonadales bacterium]|nr:hypothetical protein [Xanthomonadales bacterium]